MAQVKYNKTGTPSNRMPRRLFRVKIPSHNLLKISKTSPEHRRATRQTKKGNAVLLTELYTPGAV
jgi:hypothetical protein